MLQGYARGALAPRAGPTPSYSLDSSRLSSLVDPLEQAGSTGPKSGETSNPFRISSDIGQNFMDQPLIIYTCLDLKNRLTPFL